MQIHRFLFEIQCSNTHGAGVLWHAEQHKLYWTDILSDCLYTCVISAEISAILVTPSYGEKLVYKQDEWLKKSLQVYKLPACLGNFAFTDKPNLILAAFANGLATFDINNAQCRYLTKTELYNRKTRFNDGKCDPKGRYWLGSMLKTEASKTALTNELACLYRFDNFDFVEHTVSTHTVLPELEISNAVCFSEDALTLYHCDSSTRKIFAYTLNSQGDILDRRLFAKFDKNCFPTGACVDINGNIWVALWGGACVVCINAKGKEILRHPVPATQVSCVSIGGPNMNWLFVSSAKDGLSQDKLDKQARAGNLFVYEISEALGRVESVVNLNSG